MRRRFLPGLLLSIAVAAACGGSDSDPSSNNGNSSNGCFAVVGNKGTINNTTIQGQQNFSGVIGTGLAVYTPATSNTPASFILTALDVSNGTSVIVGGPAAVGTTTAALPQGTNLAPGYVTIQIQNRTCTAANGTWVGNSTLGVAMVTVNAVSASSVSGSFNGTLAPSAGATGNKTISGSFTATF